MADANKPDPSMVFIVFRQHNNLAKEVMDDFLKALDVNPHDLSEVATYLKEGEDDTIGNRLNAAFRTARGFMVLLTPDEEARLRDEWVEDDEEQNHTVFQPRPNVMFEAGMAYGIDESRTILVMIGKPNELTVPTDVVEKYRANLTTTKRVNKTGLKTIIDKLKRAKCEFNEDIDDSEFDEYCEKFAFATLNPREPFIASKRERRQGIDYKKISMRGKLLKSLIFEVKSESPHWRAGFLLEEPDPPNEDFEHDLSLVHDKSMLFHVGRNEQNGRYNVTAYHNQTATPGIPPKMAKPHRVSDGEKIVIRMEYDGETTVRCFVNDREYRNPKDPSFENVNPDLMKNVYLAAWGDGNGKLREYEVTFNNIEAMPVL